MKGRTLKQACTMRDQKFPPELKTWLYAQGSLTQQLTDVAGGAFKVQPLQEHYQRMSLIDSQWMKMPYQHTSWVRETYLYGCDEQPWVKAKSIFPILSLQKNMLNHFFQFLIRRPLLVGLVVKFLNKSPERANHFIGIIGNIHTPIQGIIKMLRA